MPLTVAESALIDAANAAIEAVPRRTAERQIMDHTVGCACLTSTGRVFTGINVFHFTGGPCAENIAFGNAAAAGVGSTYSPGTSDEKLVCCVAVWNDKRGVISPCGRCRQMMFDYYPEMRVIVNDVEGQGLKTVGVRELLPYAYVVAYKSPKK